MRQTLRLFTVFLTIVWAGLASAQDTLRPDPDIEATIGAQIDAFLKDDFARAFTFASPGIQSYFGSSERFGRMVQQGYPMVWRPGEVKYLELREIAGNLWQRVLIRDQLGGLHVLDYEMIRTQAGWRIDGVQILRLPGANA